MPRCPSLQPPRQALTPVGETWDVFGHVPADAPARRSYRDVFGHVPADAPARRSYRDVFGHVPADAPARRSYRDVFGHVPADGPDLVLGPGVWHYVPVA